MLIARECEASYACVYKSPIFRKILLFIHGLQWGYVAQRARSASFGDMGIRMQQAKLLWILWGTQHWVMKTSRLLGS